MDYNKFLKDHRGPQQPVLRRDLTGKTVLLVGGNTGLGFEACAHFASMKPEKLIVTARNQDKANDTVERIAQRTSYKALPAVVDLSIFDSIRAFCDHIETNYEHLDIIVLNAAVGPLQYETTPEGWESQVQVNFISQAWLLFRLMPLVKERIVLVTSALHVVASIEDEVFDNPDGILKTMSTREYYRKVYKKTGCTGRITNPYILYDRTKLLQILLIQALNSHMSTKSIIITTVSPGFCLSELRRGLSWRPSLLLSVPVNFIMEKIMAITSEEGSRDLICAALGGEQEWGPGWKEKIGNGYYIFFRRLESTSDFSRSEKGKMIGEKLLPETVELLKQLDPMMAKKIQALGL